MWTDDFFFLLPFLFMAGLLRLTYEVERGMVVGSNLTSTPKEEEDFPNLSPQRREWAKKSVEGYIRQQEKKWQRWDEKLFVSNRET